MVVVSKLTLIVIVIKFNPVRKTQVTIVVVLDRDDRLNSDFSQAWLILKH